LDSQTAPKKKIGLFLVLTLAFSSVFYYFIISGGGLQASNAALLVIGLMWCPGVAAMLTQVFFHRSLKGLGWKWGKTRYQVWSYLLPLAYAVCVYVSVWILGLGEINKDVLSRAAERFGTEDLPVSVTIVLFPLVAGIVGLLPSCLTALGEEIGWRGLLVPELAKTMTFAQTAFISGAIWAVWHYPLILFSDYRSSTPRWYAVVGFTIMVVGISFAYAWLRLKSGSLWTAMFLHASHNVFIQSVFDRLTAGTGVTEWIIGEFGAGLAIIGVVVGYVFWRKQGDLE
jgi:membrane protease YdiL (CAAX protease family)